MIKFDIKQKKGFSLLEVLIYVAILGIILVGVVQLSITIKKAGMKFSGHRTVHTDASVFLSNLDFLVKNSSGFAEDNSGLCYDFSGAQGPADYYLSLYFSTSSATTVLPPECVGKGSSVASTTAVKIYWRGSGYNSIWMDCYRAFINGNAGNCTTIEGEGNVKFRMTSDSNVAVYDGGLIFATTTVGGNAALETSLTIGSTLGYGAVFTSATTTASTTSAFRVQVGDTPAPAEAVAGDHVLAGSEVCDSDLTSACALDASYFTGQYVEDGVTCAGELACNATASACLTQFECSGCGEGGISSGGGCWYLGELTQNCNTVCTTHGGCIAENWNDDESCTLLNSLTGGCTSCGSASQTTAPYAGYYAELIDCGYRSVGTNQACKTAPPISTKRICKCTY